VEKRKFRIFPAERMLEDFSWPIWAVGWLAIFKAFLWLAYEPNLPESILELLGNKYIISMLPLVIFGIGVWNLRKWAVWGIVLVAVANLVFLIVNPQIFSGFLVKSEVTAYSIILSAIVLICSGPLGDVFILVSAPTLLKNTTNKKD
jgi:hypothetical protein